MNFNEYQNLSKRTMPKPYQVVRGFIGDIDDIELYSGMAKSNYAMGLSGEAGEVTDLIKKEVHHKHHIDIIDVKKELGDTLHYLSGIATMYGLTLEEVATANIEKLKKRYPNGFSESDSINRVE